MLLGIEYPVDRPGDIAGKEGLADEVNDLELISPLPVFQVIICGDKDDRHMGSLLFSRDDAVFRGLQPFTDLKAAHHRHIDIKGDDIRRVSHPFDHGKGLHAIFGGDHFIADTFQFSGYDCSDSGGVIDYQDRLLFHIFMGCGS